MTNNNNTHKIFKINLSDESFYIGITKNKPRYRFHSFTINCKSSNTPLYEYLRENNITPVNIEILGCPNLENTTIKEYEDNLINNAIKHNSKCLNNIDFKQKRGRKTKETIYNNLSVEDVLELV